MPSALNHGMGSFLAEQPPRNGRGRDNHTICLTAHSRARCEVCLNFLGATKEETTMPGALDHGKVSSSRSTQGTGEDETTIPSPDSAQ